MDITNGEVRRNWQYQLEHMDDKLLAQCIEICKYDFRNKELMKRYQLELLRRQSNGKEIHTTPADGNRSSRIERRNRKKKNHDV